MKIHNCKNILTYDFFKYTSKTIDFYLIFVVY